MERNSQRKAAFHMPYKHTPIFLLQRTLLIEDMLTFQRDIKMRPKDTLVTPFDLNRLDSLIDRFNVLKRVSETA